MAPERDYTADVDALLAAVTDRTKVVFLANPNNPTGTYLPRAELARLHDGLRPDILFVLDSAYAEYVTADDYEVGVDNLIEGWEIGVAGMMAGGTRIMLVPPELGYAETGQGPVPPGAILHFRVELDSIA